MAPAPAFAALRQKIETALDAALRLPEAHAGALALPAFQDALRHAVKAGGKRVRPTLTLLCAEVCGATPAQAEDALHAAVAIELLHSYTLVHDDLPCMDSDTERRGAPTVWAKYGEGTAVLAGDCLQALAFAELGSCRNAAALLPLLSRSATEVIYGQVADIAAAQAPPAQWDDALVEYVFLNKTSRLIATACALGATAAEAAPAVVAALETYGVQLGLAFQYVDDVLDAQQAQTGNELSALAVLGDAEKVRARAEVCTRRALDALKAVPGDTAALAAFAQSLLQRLV